MFFSPSAACLAASASAAFLAFSSLSSAFFFAFSASASAFFFASSSSSFFLAFASARALVSSCARSWPARMSLGTGIYCFSDLDKETSY
jgi:hypothetical protein